MLAGRGTGTHAPMECMLARRFWGHSVEQAVSASAASGCGAESSRVLPEMRKNINERKIKETGRSQSFTTPYSWEHRCSVHSPVAADAGNRRREKTAIERRTYLNWASFSQKEVWVGRVSLSLFFSRV